MLSLALSEGSVVGIAIAAAGYLVGGFAGWMNLHVRIKAVEVNHQNLSRELRNYLDRANATEQELRHTTGKLNVFLARMEERDRLQRIEERERVLREEAED